MCVGYLVEYIAVTSSRIESAERQSAGGLGVTYEVVGAGYRYWLSGIVTVSASGMQGTRHHLICDMRSESTPRKLICGLDG